MVNLNTRTTLAQEFSKTTFDKRAYAGKVGMQVAATLPGAFKAGAIIGTIAQLNELQKTFGTSKDKVSVAFEMLSRVTMGGASLLAPGAAAIVTSGYRSFESLQALKEHLSQGDQKAVLLDLFRAGSNVVYIASIVSGNPVFMAVSLLAQGSEDIFEGATMLFEQLNNDEKDFVMIGAAMLQIGLGALRGYQGASIGAKYAMTQTQKPAESRLIWSEDDLVVGELTQEQLNQVNEHFDSDQVGFLTYARLDDRGRIIKAEISAYDEEGQLDLIWKVRANNDLKITVNGFINESLDQGAWAILGQSEMPLFWDRPNRSHLPIRSIRGTMQWQLDKTHFDAQILADRSWFICSANNALSNGIQESLVGDACDAKEEFEDFSRTLESTAERFFSQHF